MARRDTQRALAIGSGPLAVRVETQPLSLTVERGGATLIDSLTPWAAHGSSADRLIQLTEGVLVTEELGPRHALEEVRVERCGASSVTLAGTLAGAGARLAVAVAHERVTLDLDGAFETLRFGAAWPMRVGERFTGLGARHGTAVDQSGRHVRLGADRRYTGPDCPREMLEVGGIPQGDYAPAPWLVSDSGYGVWLATDGAGAEFDLGATAREVVVSARTAAGPLRLHLLSDTTPVALLRHYLRLTGLPALLPEWGYGHWKSRDVYEHQDDVLDDFEGYLRNDLPLDAIVLDSPWETQYNTWQFNPHQFPDAVGMIRRMRGRGVRTVVWVTPWVNLESADGQRPPDAESERLHRDPAPNYAPAARAGHFVVDQHGEPYVGRWWMGTGSPVDFTSTAADAWWREQARRVLELGVEGIKADDGEGYYLPPSVRFADGRSGAQAAWAFGDLYRRSMQRALDEVHPGRGVLFGRSGWSGQQRQGMLWGGDQASDFWSLRALVVATLTAAASGFSNWSHDIGGYLGERLVARCPKELLIRWLEFGCFTPLMQAHGRFEQEAWTYDLEALDIYRRYVVLHERLVPYVRAAAATAHRCGLPIIRPLALLDPRDARGFEVTDAYGYGPALWVAPVVEAGVASRTVDLPRGDWIDFWTGQRVCGGGTVVAHAPLARIPVWVRSGSLVVSYPRDHVAEGLGDTPERERPLEATLWGEPPLGCAGARLADGTEVRWRHGTWSVDPPREVRCFERPALWRDS